MRAVALPESINQILALPPGTRAGHLPIVTTVDFALARAGGGPDWRMATRDFAMRLIPLVMARGDRRVWRSNAASARTEKML